MTNICFQFSGSRKCYNNTPATKTPGKLKLEKRRFGNEGPFALLLISVTYWWISSNVKRSDLNYQVLSNLSLPYLLILPFLQQHNNNQTSTTTNHQPPTTNDQQQPPTTNNRQPTTDSRQPTTANNQTCTAKCGTTIW